jgi:ATP-dependent exoDNAse (exonuclease V) beta subunit
MIVIGNFHHLKLNIKPVELERKEIAGQRFYQTPDGLFPSVTTVTGHEKKKFFAEWRKNNPTESERVCSRGNTLHSVVEKYLLNEKININEYDDNIRDLFLTLKPELDKINNIRCLEFPLWSKTLELAGRVDCIAEYNKELSVIDFKGSTKTKFKKDIENYFTQATAYALMWQERTGERIKNIKILMATEDGVCQIFEEKPIDYVRSLKEIKDKYISDTLL